MAFNRLTILNFETGETTIVENVPDKFIDVEKVMEENFSSSCQYMLSPSKEDVRYLQFSEFMLEVADIKSDKS